MSDLAARLALITQHAPDLRKAGVSALTIGDVSFALHPAEPEPVAETSDAPAQSSTDPLNDPATYGWKNGTPGFRDPREVKS